MFLRRCPAVYGAVAIVLLAAGIAVAQESRSTFTPPDDIAFRTATIHSEGTRMAAEVFAPKNPAGEKLPTIVLARLGRRGIGLAAMRFRLRRAGYLVLIFDYRGWGERFARDPHRTCARSDEGLCFTAEVQEVREVVDPIDQTTDLANAVSWIYGEPQCDRERIGLWGSSYSGGHVVYVAARSARESHGQPGAGL